MTIAATVRRFGVLCLLSTTFGVAQSAIIQKPVVVSPTHPKDSRGETVYDEQDPAHPESSVIHGVFSMPVLRTSAKPKMPFSSRMHHRKIHIVVEGVVSENGDLIDASLVKADQDAALAKSVLDAFSQWKFKPATLDGKPVAVLLTQEFTFNIF